MARFYDTVSYSDLRRVEGLLKKGGIVYTLRELDDEQARMKEIQVAEEDLAAAERVLYGTSHPDN